MKMTYSKSAIYALIGTAAIFATSCSKPGKPAVVENEEVEAVYAVDAFKTTESNMDDYLEFGGDVVSVNAVSVMPDMAGKVSRINVSVGDRVSKDQVIAYVDASRPGMNYSASPVKAPIAGRITALPATVGTMVSQQSSIATISNTDTLEIKINIAERFISRIKEGQIASVTFDAYPSEDFKAKVFEVSPVLDTSTRTMSVKLRFTPQDKKIKVGMYGRVRLVTKNIQNAIVVPSVAIVTKNGNPYVFAVSGNGKSSSSVELRAVKLGISVDNYTEIVEGLEVNEEIVIKGQTLLNDGSSVNVISVSQLD